MTFSGVLTSVGGGDPPLASYLTGDSNERFEFKKNYKRIKIFQLVRKFLSCFNSNFF